MKKEALKVLIAYAQEDLAVRNELVHFLKEQFPQRHIAIFYDREIDSDHEWASVIHEHINRIHIVLLLISPEFVASDYCYGLEIKRAMERHKANRIHVLPIVIRETDWKDTSFSELKPLNADNAVVIVSGTHAYVFSNIARIIQEIVNKSLLPLQDGIEVEPQSNPTIPDEVKSPITWIAEDLRCLALMIWDLTHPRWLRGKKAIPPRWLRGNDPSCDSSSLEVVVLKIQKPCSPSYDDSILAAVQEYLSKAPKPDGLCYVSAEIDGYLISGHATTMDVIVSADELVMKIGPACQEEKISIASDKKLIIQVIAKTNLRVEGPDQKEVDPPKPGQKYHLLFDLRPTNLGEGETWVVIQQGQTQLMKLSLKSQILESRAQIQEASRIRANGSITDFPAPSEPIHQLWIIEQCNGSQITYRYIFDSPKLNIKATYISEPINCDRTKYIEALYREIESRWDGNQDNIEDFTKELRVFGGQLFDQLFPKKLQELLWQHRDQIESIMVLSMEPFIPWELVHLKEPGYTLPEETRFLGQMGLVRWLEGHYPPQRMHIREGRAYYVIPHYPVRDSRLPETQQEAQFLEQTFKAEAVEPQPDKVRELLKSRDFDLLHFAGHGMADQDNIDNARVMLQGKVMNNKYIRKYLSSGDVEQFYTYRTEDKNPPMVVLNACQVGREGYNLTGIGGFAKAFLEHGTGVFVGPLWSVGDRPARIFTETLYQGLIEGLTLSTATVKAREQAKQIGSATWLAYAVYGHPYLTITKTESESRNDETVIC